MSEVLVSVVVPTYDDGDTIARAIESALEQTLEDLEVIVVDDGSTDDTDDVVRSYDDPRLTYVEHETNQGGSAARNTGIGRAGGEYVAFLDADDEWRPEKLERQVECLEERSDEWVAAYCGYEKVPATLSSRVQFALGGLFGGSTDAREGGEDLIDDVVLGEFALGGASTLVVRREVAVAIDGFDEAFPRHQDWEFLIRVLERGRLAHVDEPLVVKYSTSVPDAESIRESKELFIEKFDETVERLDGEGYDVVGRHRFELSRLYFREGQFRRGMYYFRESDPYRHLRLTPLVFSLCLGTIALLRPSRRSSTGTSETVP